MWYWQMRTTAESLPCCNVTIMSKIKPLSIAFTVTGTCVRKVGIAAFWCRCGGLNALHAIGVGHDDALDILDNVAAYADLDFVRHDAKHIPRLGGGVGDGNRFGAAHGRDQFLLEDLHIPLVALQSVRSGVLYRVCWFV